MQGDISRSETPGLRLAGELGSAAFFLAAAVLWTWPLLPRLSTHLRDAGDPASTAWVVAWVQHALTHDPAHLFQSNCFAPERDALAFSEPLLGYGIAGLPLRWLGANPLAVHNGLFLLGLAFSPWAIARLARRLGAGWWPSIVGAAAAGFGALETAHLSHLVFTGFGWIAVAVECGLALRDRPSAGRIAVGGLAWATIGWFSMQLFAFGSIVFLVLALIEAYARVQQKEGSRVIRWVTAVGGTALIAAVALLPIVVPLLRVRNAHGFVRSPAETRQYSAKPNDWFGTTDQNPGQRWIGKINGAETALYPGSIALALTLIALFLGWRRRNRAEGGSKPLVVGGAFVLVGFLGSLGYRSFFYPGLVQLFPFLFGGIRCAARFAYVAQIGFGLLAAAGADSVIATIGKRFSALAVVALLLILWFDVRTDERFAVAVEWPPAGADGFLATQDLAGPILHLPYYANPPDSPYMLASAVHFFPIVNGITSYVPSTHSALRDRLRRLDSREDVLADIEAWPIEVIVLHDHSPHRHLVDRLRAWLSSGVEAGRLGEPLRIEHGDGVDWICDVRRVRGAKAWTATAPKPAWAALRQSASEESKCPSWTTGDSRWQQIVPSVARARGAGGSIWTTDLMLFNPNPDPAEVRIALRSDGLERCASVGLAPYQRRVWTDAVADLFGPLEAFIGHFQVSSDSPLHAVSSTYDASRTRSGVWEPAVALEDARLEPSYFLGLPPEARVHLALANPGRRDGEVEFACVDEATGARVGIQRAPVLAGEWRRIVVEPCARFVVTPLGDVPIAASLTFASPSGIATTIRPPR